MIGMGAEASTIRRAEAADFFFDCWAVGLEGSIYGLIVIPPSICMERPKKMLNQNGW
jgi:hypothetical protein